MRSKKKQKIKAKKKSHLPKLSRRWGSPALRVNRTDIDSKKEKEISPYDYPPPGEGFFPQLF